MVYIVSLVGILFMEVCYDGVPNLDHQTTFALKYPDETCLNRENCKWFYQTDGT